MPYTFIAAIADDRIGTAGYRDWVRRQLAEGGFTLEDNGDLMCGDGLVGFYQFLDREEGRRLLPEDARPLVEKPGPYNGRGRLFQLDACGGSANRRGAPSPAIISISRSIIARTDNGRHMETVRLIEFPLSSLVGNHGFDDGDALISRDDDYLRYVQREAEAALAAGALGGRGSSTRTTIRSDWSGACG